MISKQPTAPTKARPRKKPMTNTQDTTKSRKAKLKDHTLPETPLETSTSPITSVCVYCGSGKGLDPAYAIAARKLGKALADNNIRLVYGGGSLGLMGEVAKAALGAGGHVTGIIPEFLGSREQMLKDVNELIVVEDMHVRKRLMFERSDAFVALPGGIGTLEELVEQLTWSQLGRHAKPIVVANIKGFWTPFLDLLAHMKGESFIRPGLDVRFTVVDTAEAIVPAILSVAHVGNGASDAAITAKF
jgi:uncharacterized protein (TIGR00730 family)